MISADHSITTEDMRFAPYWWDAAYPVASETGPLPPVADVVVVGSGYTGLRAALLLARAGRQVVVVDREDPGSGAARRNAGFLGRVLKKSFLGLRNSRGLEHANHVYRELDQAYQTLMAFIAEEEIDCFAARDGRFIGATSPAHYELLARELEAVNKHLGLPYAMVGRHEVRKELATDIYHGGATIPDLGSLHPGLYHQGLLERTAAAGVTIRGRTDVTGIVRKNDPYRFLVTTTAGNLAARDVIVATNGYTTARLGWWSRRVIPFQGYMAATEELTPELIRKIIPHRRVVIDTDTNIDFFRPAPDSNRILLGGATAGGMQSADEIAIKMHAIMARALPDLRRVKLSHVWTGFCAGTFDLMPHAGGRGGLWHAMGYNFAGVTMGSYLGHKIAQQILGDPEGRTVFSQDPFPTMPFYRGKPWFMPAAMKYFDWKDRKTARTPLDRLKAH
ncbi:MULTISPECIES: NAD(P)/FAD-dependent oxidoreductase [Mesorhizobium]|uniref:NAD(P)/FAD-dependent oxidoreductase n=1 Tax=Mesorhizobium TaxID=68287 RepID=UPI0010A954C2|nr:MULTISPECIES: FAD-binding oxidoreductase [Mesorhizobium]